MFDLHCHIIFEVDDGASSLHESVAMLQQARSSGIRTIVATPHCRGSWWQPEAIKANYDTLRGIAQDAGIQLDLGCEVHWKKLAELGLDMAPKLTLGESNLILLEFSNDAMPGNWENLIYKLRGMGLVPVIAHPERYKAVQRDLDVAYKLKDLGCYLQLSANFVEEGRFSDRRKAALGMLKQGLVDYVASDAHCAGDYASYRKALALAQDY